MKLPPFLPRFLLVCALAFTTCACLATSNALESSVSSPGGTVSVFVNDTEGLDYWVEAGGKPLVQECPVGLEFSLSAIIRKAGITRNDSSWDNPFGNRRMFRLFAATGGFEAVLAPSP